MKIICFLSIFILFLAINPYKSGADEIYTIKKGDSLYKIAKKFKVSIEEIKETNGLAPTRLKIGTRLTIPTSESQGKKKSNKKKDTAKNVARESINTETSPHSGVFAETKEPRKDAHPQETQYHTVKNGETLASISKKYSISIGDLKEINNIKDSRRLKVGMQLLIKRTGPRTYTVKRGDNIWKIAKRFAMSAEELIEINELDSEELRPGQKLILEVQAEPIDTKNYTTIISEARFIENLKELSESQELSSMSMKDRLILFARKMLDIPYRFGGNTLMGIDCSGYVQKVFGFLNIPLPRTAREQFEIGESISKKDLSIGDLVFFRTYASFPSHVGIYLGNNLFIHASSKNRKVSIDSLDTPYYIRRFIGAKRLFPEELEYKKETDEKG